MTKQDLSALVAEILKDMGQEPQVKASTYVGAGAHDGPQMPDHHYHDGECYQPRTIGQRPSQTAPQERYHRSLPLQCVRDFP